MGPLLCLWALLPYLLARESLEILEINKRNQWMNKWIDKMEGGREEKLHEKV